MVAGSRGARSGSGDGADPAAIGGSVFDVASGSGSWPGRGLETGGATTRSGEGLTLLAGLDRGRSPVSIAPVTSRWRLS